MAGTIQRTGGNENLSVGARASEDATPSSLSERVPSVGLYLPLGKWLYLFGCVQRVRYQRVNRVS